jgi:hypothetical protein
MAQIIKTFQAIISKQWQIIKPEIKKIAIGFALGVGGALITFFETSFIPDVKDILVVYVPAIYIPLTLGFVTAVNSAIINTLRKYCKESVYVVPTGETILSTTTPEPSIASEVLQEENNNIAPIVPINEVK